MGILLFASSGIAGDVEKNAFIDGIGSLHVRPSKASENSLDFELVSGGNLSILLFYCRSFKSNQRLGQGLGFSKR